MCVCSLILTVAVTAAVSLLENCDQRIEYTNKSYIYKMLANHKLQATIFFHQRRLLSLVMGKSKRNECTVYNLNGMSRNLQCVSVDLMIIVVGYTFVVCYFREE